MAYSLTQFENNLTNPLQALDNNFTTFGALVPIPCSVAGTNTLTLTQNRPDWCRRRRYRPTPPTCCSQASRAAPTLAR